MGSVGIQGYVPQAIIYIGVKKRISSAAGERK